MTPNPWGSFEKTPVRLVSGWEWLKKGSNNSESGSAQLVKYRVMLDQKEEYKNACNEMWWRKSEVYCCLTKVCGGVTVCWKATQLKPSHAFN